MSERIRLCELAKKHGAKNVRFFMPARPLGVSWDDFWSKTPIREIKEFHSVESFNRELAQGYKVRLRCVEPGYHEEEFYQMDLEKIMQEKPDAFWAQVVMNPSGNFEA